MGRSNASEIRVTQTTYVSPERLDGNTTSARPKWLWGWVTVFFLLGLLALTLVGVWISETGGVSWGDMSKPNLMFNYHPLFIILGFLFITGHTNLLYRLWPEGNITALRWTHALLQLTSYILVVMGVYAVGFSKDYTSTKPSHFVSVHSWVGLTLLTVMTLQWVCGFFGLLVPGCQGERRQQYRDTHIFTGNFVFFLGCANILIGIDQLKPNATMNTLALTVVAFAALGGYLLATNKFKRGHAEHPDERANPDERAPLTSQGRGVTYD